MPIKNISKNKTMAIKNVVFDYDGTCTQIPLIYDKFLERYLEELNKRLFPSNLFTADALRNPISKMEWEDAQKVVRKKSPYAGWTLETTSAAPAAADPYILAFESARLVLRNRRNGHGEVAIPFEIHRDSNDAHEAPWRKEARNVLEKLLKKGLNVYFISNSSSTKITGRLKELLKVDELPATLKVQSDAAKFRISELPIASNPRSSLSQKAIATFKKLPAVDTSTADGRPVYLRRGNYFAAICAALRNDASSLEDTVFCGDIWEMDLAMPYALGGKIHLIKRAAPFDTYSYEVDAVKASKGKISDNLNGLLEWF
jgi:phosphoglycolate phosphatase-like HAD superfamily hydrolase